MTAPLTLAQLLSELVTGVIFGSEQVVIDHITEDSRAVRPGSLFVARKGEKSDGRKFVGDAVRRGASAVLCQSGDGVEESPRLEVPDLLEAWARLAQAISGWPARRLKVVGITGTNGKTTVASLVAQALSHLGQTVARSGTLGFYLGDEKIADSLTTPMPDQLAALLSEAVQRGASYAILEVSSHALAQKRVAGLDFAVAAFTNLSQDHLDYHGTLEAYGAEKERLLSEYRPQASVVNLDDSWGRALYAKYAQTGGMLGVQCESTSTTGRSNSNAPVGPHEARLVAREPEWSAVGVRALVEDRAGSHLRSSTRLNSTLLGRHNLENLLVAWGVLRQLGFASQEIAPALGAASGVAGRFERCESEADDIVVVVDYAHTPDALGRALETLSSLAFSQISCVFGCGGDRDRSKRPLMGAEVARFAHRIFVTSDNPRTESPQAIVDDILPGLASAAMSPIVNLDRRSSIEQAVAEAQPGSCVLIAGKGHEDYQIIGTQVFSFDDRIEARRALTLRRAARAAGEKTR